MFSERTVITIVFSAVIEGSVSIARSSSIVNDSDSVCQVDVVYRAHDEEVEADVGLTDDGKCVDIAYITYLCRRRYTISMIQYIKSTRCH
jgi:hypothetical protein